MDRGVGGKDRFLRHRFVVFRKPAEEAPPLQSVPGPLRHRDHFQRAVFLHREYVRRHPAGILAVLAYVQVHLNAGIRLHLGPDPRIPCKDRVGRQRHCVPFVRIPFDEKPVAREASGNVFQRAVFPGPQLVPGQLVAVPVEGDGVRKRDRGARITPPRIEHGIAGHQDLARLFSALFLRVPAQELPSAAVVRLACERSEPLAGRIGVVSDDAAPAHIGQVRLACGAPYSLQRRFSREDGVGRHLFQCRLVPPSHELQVSFLLDGRFRQVPDLSVLAGLHRGRKGTGMIVFLKGDRVNAGRRRDRLLPLDPAPVGPDVGILREHRVLCNPVAAVGMRIPAHEDQAGTVAGAKLLRQLAVLVGLPDIELLAALPGVEGDVVHPRPSVSGCRCAHQEQQHQCGQPGQHFLSPVHVVSLLC